jgi:hypothetical protein
MGNKQTYPEEWQEIEHSQDINNPEPTGSDPLQKL